MERLNGALEYHMICVDCGSIFKASKDDTIQKPCPHCGGDGLFWITNRMGFWQHSVAVSVGKTSIAGN